jgi:hypothetical protein
VIQFRDLFSLKQGSSPFIKLDYDGELPDDLDYRIAWTCRTVGLAVRYVRCDRTRRGWHVTVRVSRRVDPISLVALQAILGSHAEREAFNLMRVRNLRNVKPFWRRRWNVFYRRHNREGEIQWGD